MAGSNIFSINWPMNTFSVAFVVSSGDISGGTNVVFRHAMHLAETGVQVAIVSNPALTRKAVSWHPVSAVFSHPKLRWLDFFDASAMKFDVAIATFWITCFDLWKVNSANYVFFVQSIEFAFLSRVRPAAAQRNRRHVRSALGVHHRGEMDRTLPSAASPAGRCGGSKRHR